MSRSDPRRTAAARARTVGNRTARALKSGNARVNRAGRARRAR